MKVYKSQSEVEKDIKDGVLAIEGDVKFECNISVSASIIVTAGNITAWNITAWDINARNINAWDINAWNINALDICYYAVCFAYKNIKCLSIKARREASKHFCLDGEITIQKDAETAIGTEVEVKMNGKSYKAKIIEEN